MIAAFGRGKKSNLRVTDVAPHVEVGGEQADRDVASLTFTPSLQRDPCLLSSTSPPIGRPRHVRQVPARQPPARHDERIQRRRPEVRPRPHPVRGPGLSGRYIHDFTKALSGEVRVLLDEVGALRDERRRLQQCVLRVRGGGRWG
jgi:hypothetical protein